MERKGLFRFFSAFPSIQLDEYTEKLRIYERANDAIVRDR